MTPCMKPMRMPSQLPSTHEERGESEKKLVPRCESTQKAESRCRGREKGGRRTRVRRKKERKKETRRAYSMRSLDEMVFIPFANFFHKICSAFRNSNCKIASQNGWFPRFCVFSLSLSLSLSLKKNIYI